MPQQHVSLKSGFDAGVEKGGRSEDELAGVVLVEHAPKTPFAVFLGNLGYVAEHVGEQVTPFGAGVDGQPVEVVQESETVGFGQRGLQGAEGYVLEQQADHEVGLGAVVPGRGLRQQRGGVGNASGAHELRVELRRRGVGVRGGELVVAHRFLAEWDRGLLRGAEEVVQHCSGGAQLVEEEVPVAAGQRDPRHADLLPGDHRARGDTGVVEQEHGYPLVGVAVDVQDPLTAVDHVGWHHPQLPDGPFRLAHRLGGHLLDPGGFCGVVLGRDGAGLDLHDRTSMAGQQQAVTEFTEA
ncbi:hypothetical protein [Streptomyces sp. CEV 2-1]|uniref:hypothetical protein n=1 Tax=Streptomyces sp. CEV 2-1 TaxID=2485153 RepID=UPI000F46E459|nr:hypothetical protein [Streptomyces sp. CEV 2-1]